MHTDAHTLRHTPCIRATASQPEGEDEDEFQVHWKPLTRSRAGEGGGGFRRRPELGAHAPPGSASATHKQWRGTIALTAGLERAGAGGQLGGVLVPGAALARGSRSVPSRGRGGEERAVW